MRLEKAQYTEFAGTDREWSFEPATFGEINLLVGKNASGKTRLLNVLGNSAKIMAGRVQNLHATGDHHFTFSRGSAPPYEYSFSLENANVVRESLKAGAEEYIVREGSGPGKIRMAPKNDLVPFQIKATQLALVSKRDSIQHPFIEELAEWAERTEHYDFAAINIGTGRPIGVPNMFPSMQALQDLEKPLTRESQHRELVQLLLLAGLQKYKDKFKEGLLEDFKKIGYFIDDIGIGVSSTIIATPPAIGMWVKENDLRINTEQTAMSWGMFRAVSAVIRANLAVLGERPSAVFIDDIGEGLDFSRADSLVRLLIEKAKQGDFQLFMTSNDRFIMNEVPLEYWNVLLRTGPNVRIKNFANSADEFRKFQKIGLNNFDFFVSQQSRK